MSIGSSATPLLALDAVVIDTETTGLDARKARIVEIALVPLVGGQLDVEGAWRSLIRPDVAIPKQATKIHGLDAAAVAAAPTFAEAWGDLAARIANQVVIGHAVGFDLVVIERECARAGLAWTRPRALDTRLLAEVAAPSLAGYALEDLAAWLEIEIGGRHSALGDATAAGRAFVALLPHLRELGIRTLAEAERSCRALSDALEKQQRAGWTAAGSTSISADADPQSVRVDTQPYRRQVHDVMTAPPRFAAPGASLAMALGRMADERISSLFVRYCEDDGQPLPADTGIITERDVMRRVVAERRDPETTTLEEVMTRTVAFAAPHTTLDEIRKVMRDKRIRHVPVVEGRRVTGMISIGDLNKAEHDVAVETIRYLEQYMSVG